MALPSEFNANQALPRSVTLLWENGYDRASLTKPTDPTGIARADFYGTVGLCDQALHFYDAEYCASLALTAPSFISTPPRGLSPP